MMSHKDARAGFPDDRSLWKWQQQRAARQLEQDFRRLGHHETAENWRKEAERLKVDLGQKYG